MPLRPSLLFATLLPLPALAQEAPPTLPFTYAMFEESVPHVDLDVCPVPLDGPDRFCRMTSQLATLNVFVFSDQGDQPLIAYRSWPAELLAGLMD
ncbi:hypothetical protein LHP98_03945 [Rhodobacter sp. Har01]|uniref:hypothetical protein n=1 Tax=Rhodobacter sp. Har01 TaxID=2883999 RepID=UPI001D097878|nr:hypothetical protein [Rhodobacter sp. Har01]MCB6177279.1 hypothetical protein [Rhodobacter sp. Har01]